MKLSLSWIKDYVKIPEDMDLKKLAYDLTMSTVEVEDVEYLARRFDKMVVGVIEKVEPHPNADKLRVCQVDVGEGESKTIVCGGINLKEGMRVAVSCPGALVRWHGEGEPVVIKNSKLRGVESYGMICASDEIGLSELFPASEEAEILDLSDFDVPAGTPLAKALDMDDVLLEIDNKSMTNRPDLWGHYGIAREIAALYDLPLEEIKPFETEVQSDFRVEIEDPDRCGRYIGVEMSGVEVKPSPYRMRNRIWKAGMRPINALVDITNYVMLATGNPTHAFDADNITDHIVVRHAAEGEKLVLLNDHELTLYRFRRPGGLSGRHGRREGLHPAQNKAGDPGGGQFRVHGRAPDGPALRYAHGGFLKIREGCGSGALRPGPGSFHEVFRGVVSGASGHRFLRPVCEEARKGENRREPDLAGEAPG